MGFFQEMRIWLETPTSKRDAGTQTPEEPRMEQDFFSRPFILFALPSLRKPTRNCQYARKQPTDSPGGHAQGGMGSGRWAWGL